MKIGVNHRSLSEQGMLPRQPLKFPLHLTMTPMILRSNKHYQACLQWHTGHLAKTKPLTCSMLILNVILRSTILIIPIIGIQMQITYIHPSVKARDRSNQPQVIDVLWPMLHNTTTACPSTKFTWSIIHFCLLVCQSLPDIDVNASLRSDDRSLLTTAHES